MLSVGRLAVSLAFAGSVFAGPVQNPFVVLPPSARAHRDAVQQIFTESYSAYKLVHSSCSLFLLTFFHHFREFAFGHDDLSPLSQGMVLAYFQGFVSMIRARVFGWT
jgi:mannosyl-oligosaccharide alpha-1,2-mannosidase